MHIAVLQISNLSLFAIGLKILAYRMATDGLTLKKKATMHTRPASAAILTIRLMRDLVPDMRNTRNPARKATNAPRD